MKSLILTSFIALMPFCMPHESLTAQTVGVNEPIISLTSIPVTFVNVRPDIAGAVGTGDDVCVATNDYLKSSTKSGQAGAYDTFVDGLTPFFYSFDNPIAYFAGSNATGDPQLIFDPFSNRWFYTSLVVIAVSDGPQLKNATWKRFSYNMFLINPTGDSSLSNNGDYDQTGIDQHALIMGMVSLGSFRPYILVVQKASLLSGGPLIANKFVVPRVQGSFQANPVGVTNFDANPPYSYAIATGSLTIDTLNIYRFANSGTPNPTLSTITLSLPGTDFALAPYGCHPGSFEQIPQPYELYQCGDTEPPFIDGRVMSPAHIRDNQLYFCEMVTTFSPFTAAVAIRWYQIDLTDPDNPCVVQFGDITIPDEIMPINTINFYYPTLMTNTTQRIVPSSESGCVRDVPTHTMVIGFSSGTPSGAQQTLSLYAYGFLPTGGTFYNAMTTGRLATDPLGQTTPPITLTNSQNGIDRNYYGDFSSSALDPADNKTIWQFAQQCDAPGSYAIQATQILNQ